MIDLHQVSGYNAESMLRQQGFRTNRDAHDVSRRNPLPLDDGSQRRALFEAFIAATCLVVEVFTSPSPERRANA